MSGKREVPTPLRKLLDLDVRLSEKFCLFMNKFLPLRSFKVYFKALEISCHGLLWLSGWLAFVWIINSSTLYQMQVNFFIGLLLDIVFVAVIKAYVRRKRPAGNGPHMFGTFGPDVYSFPSGHVSRGTFIMLFFMFLHPLPLLLRPPLFGWVTGLSISRVLLKRHHILDVIGGIFLGIFEAFLLSFLWLSRETSTDLLSFLTNEKLEGGEYHV